MNPAISIGNDLLLFITIKFIKAFITDYKV